MITDKIFQKILPMVDEMTLIQLKINQLNGNSNSNVKEIEFLKNCYMTLSDGISKILVEENIPFIQERIKL